MLTLSLIKLHRKHNSVQSYNINEMDVKFVHIKARRIVDFIAFESNKT